jgi:inorganic pyrophosphatase
MKCRCLLLALLVCSVPAPVRGQQARTPAAPLRKTADRYTLVGQKHLFSGYPATATGGMIHVVVEIPAGTSAKWEVDKDDGRLKWEVKNGRPRVGHVMACHRGQAHRARRRSSPLGKPASKE